MNDFVGNIFYKIVLDYACYYYVYEVHALNANAYLSLCGAAMLLRR